MSEGGDSLNTPVVQPQLRALMLPLPLPGAKGDDATFVFSPHHSGETQNGPRFGLLLTAAINQ